MPKSKVKKLPREGYIDLHVHSNCSDGKKSPEEIIQISKQNGVCYLAFCEHYNLGSYKRARKAAGNSIEIIPAIEIGASLADYGFSNNHICHIVAYYPSNNICKELDRYEISPEKCVKKTLDKLARNYMKIPFKEVQKHARCKSHITRYDVAITISKLGYSKSPIEAYGDFLDYGKCAYVEREKLAAETLIRNILQVGGVPVLVHPKSLSVGFTDFEIILKLFAEAGLKGLEVFNPHHTKEQVERFSGVASEYGLITTAGSDYHGMQLENFDIGIGMQEKPNLLIRDSGIITSLKEARNEIYLTNPRKGSLIV